MTGKQTIGRVHSLQSLGTVDGPGVRFVVFMQGCNLRCGCCHNPDTWQMLGGSEYTPAELLQKILRFREYFGEQGGVTVSGGEPLLQHEFVTELFTLCKQNGINTCLDTSGSLLCDGIKRLLAVTDRVLLDIKYTSEELYQKYVGCELKQVTDFLEYLDSQSIPTTVRQVIIPTLNAGEDDVTALLSMIKSYSCIDKTELLPFKKICAVKYEELDIDFKFSDMPTPTAEQMSRLRSLL